VLRSSVLDLPEQCPGRRAPQRPHRPKAPAGEGRPLHLRGTKLFPERRLLVEDHELEGAEARAGGIRPSVVTKAGPVMSDVVASQVSVRDLKTHLSEWLARAQAGEVVEVTSHRKPIARITAVKPAEPTSTDPLQKAIDAGLISWTGQKPVFPPPIKLSGKGRLISEIVIEDRG